MERLKEYQVAYRGLKEGTHAFHYVMDESFFNCFEATSGTEGEVKATVELIKSSLLMELRISLEGEVKATCDRCLEDLMLPVSGTLTLILKEGGEREEQGDDFIVLAPDDDYLDLSGPLYELYMLNYPLRVIHPEGDCNPEMEQVLNAFVLNKENDDNNTIDPRWDELRKLINN